MLKLLFQCGSRGCIKIVKDAGKGQRSCPIMLNAGRGAAEPGVELPPPHKTSSQRANIFVFRLLFAPYGDGSAGVMTTPGSAPLRSPRPALSIIGQLRSPFSHFDTPSTIWPSKLFDIKRFIHHNYQDAIICRLYKAPPGDTFR